MTEIAKVIKGLECCRNVQCASCPYYNDGVNFPECVPELRTDALELLKDDETQLQYRDEVIYEEEKETARLRKLLKEHEAQGWISVKDRLPEVDTNVLAYARGKNDPIYRIIIASMSDSNYFDVHIKTKPYWREPWQFFDTMYEITHWMPMPEPPKEEDGE